jgi:hypothetical protein
VYEYQGTIDEFQIEKRSYEGGSLENKHNVRDLIDLSAHNKPKVFEDYPLAAAAAASPTPAAVTPIPSIAYGSGVIQPLSSSVSLPKLSIIKL